MPKSETHQLLLLFRLLAVSGVSWMKEADHAIEPPISLTRIIAALVAPGHQRRNHLLLEIRNEQEKLFQLLSKRYFRGDCDLLERLLYKGHNQHKRTSLFQKLQAVGLVIIMTYIGMNVFFRSVELFDA